MTQLYGLFTSVVLMFVLVAAFGLPAEAQVICAQIGQFLSCDAPRGQSTTQLDLGKGMGVITDSQGHVEPYAVLQPNRSQPSMFQAPQAPQAPRAPQAPSFPSGGTSDLIQVPQAPAPIFAPFSLGDSP
jgi:hypothetical protein